MTQADQMKQHAQSVTTAREAHTAEMKAYNATCNDIARCEQERQAAIEAGREAESSWRARFRSSRGNLTDELRAQHSQRIASRELAGEFTGLIEVLELDKQSNMLSCCATGKRLVEAHRSALNGIADIYWQSALRCVSPKLLHALRLRMLARSPEENDNEKPEQYVARNIGEELIKLASRVSDAQLLEDPELAQVGLHRPALTGVDMNLYGSPARRMQLGAELKARREKLEQEHRS
ncbi:hypothetical protein [uncultured Pantoea sp.]|uniref:hypothetical protein n=1 Tax=uncultured Pantoea sp. TaxID=218084 RepID=UPI003748A222